MKVSHDKCIGIGGCASVWPVLKRNGQTIAGKGVRKSMLGSIGLPHGVRQVTYAGHPLYTYSADTPGSTSYVGFKQFGGSWDGLTSTGRLVK